MRRTPSRQLTPSVSPATRQARLIVLVAAIAALLVAVAPNAQAGAPLKNGAWIKKARVLIAGSPAFEDGSLGQHARTPLETVSPYWGNYAAIGLARAGGTVKIGLADDWLSWYRSKVAGSGLISKYLLDPQGTDPESYTATATGSETDVNTDSPAAYAASHLLAMQEYRQATSKKKIRKHKKQIRYSALLLLRQIDSSDGLVWSHPTGTAGRMKSLITQAESYAALEAAVGLLDDVGYSSASALAATGADQIRAGLDGLWLPAVGAYATLKDENGALHVTDWSTWYADALGQAWVVAVGNGMSPGDDLIDPARASALMSTLTSTWPEWNRPGFRPSFGRKAGTASGLIGYQPMVGVALTEVGRGADARSGVDNINSYAIGKARKWPFNVGNAGQILLTLSGA